ncbi:hypothetical protein QQ045_030286 [Rhodiola kirilowii]
MSQSFHSPPKLDNSMSPEQVVETPDVTTEQISTVEDELKNLLSDAPIVERM